MSTYTIRPQERHHETRWSLGHPLITTVLILAAAVIVGVLAGILFSLLVDSAKVAPVHRAGGHGQPTVAAARHASAAAASVESSGTAAPAMMSGERSPARGGFAVGRSSGAGSGFIVLNAGSRAPARGGFPGRSLGARRAAPGLFSA
jgi:hypothetical protein